MVKYHNEYYHCIIIDAFNPIDKKYELINELCIKNNAYPFFKDPINVSECEKTRLDIVKIIPEEIINDFFWGGRKYN